MRTPTTLVFAAASLAACAHASQGGTPVGAAAPEAREVTSEPPSSEPEQELLAARDVRVEAGLLAPMPTALTSFGAASDGRYLYLAGGYHGVPHQYSREGQSTELQRLALDGSGGWETLGQLPEGAQGLEVVYHDGRLCRFGGSVAKNDSGEPTDMHSSRRASCFNLETRRWEALPDLPVGRSSHAVTRIGSKVYVAGGWSMSGEASEAQWQTDMLVLDLARPEAGWASVEAPMKRRAVGVAAAGGKVVVVGGLTPAGEMSREVDVYDSKTGTWSKGPAFPEDAFGVAVAGMHDGSIVASARSGRLFRWVPGALQWEPSGSLAFGRFFHQLVDAGGGKLVAVGGISGMHRAGRTRHVELVDLAGTRARLTAWSMAHHGRAKNRQAAFVEGDYLYLFGGNDSLGQHDFAEENFVAEGLRIHLPSMTTERVEDFPAKRQSMVVVRQDETVYAVGGFGFAPGGAVTQTEVYAFDPETGAWRQAGALPSSRTQFGAFADGDGLWVLGGLHYDPSEKGEAAFDHRLDVLHGSPAELTPIETPLPAPRRAFAGTLHEGHYYMIGGMKGGFQLVETCTRFEIEARRFTDVPCPGAPRLSGALVPMEDHLLLVGGSVRAGDELEVSRVIEAYDPEAETWTRLADELPFSTRHAHVLTYGERLLIVSTHNEEGRIRIALLDPTPELMREAGAKAAATVDGPAPVVER